jgi:hypothetical protein
VAHRKPLLTFSDLKHGSKLHIRKGPGKDALMLSMFDFPEGKKRHSVTFHVGRWRFKAIPTMVEIIDVPEQAWKIEAHVYLKNGHYQYHVVAKIQYCTLSRQGSVQFTHGRGTDIGAKEMPCLMTGRYNRTG